MNLTVLGAGCWGLTLSVLLAQNFDKITIWGRSGKKIDELKKNHELKTPINVKLPENAYVTDDFENATKKGDIILLTVSTSAVREICTNIAKIGLTSKQIIVNTSKGLEMPSMFRMSQVIKEELPGIQPVVLSGPTLAEEVLKGFPTAACVACENEKIAKIVQKKLSVKNKFRLYTNTDVIGVELGGSLKNIIATASGFAYQKGLGYNTLGALLSRGMAEIVRTGIIFGANPATLYGLSGMGDLIATCSTPLSRNFRVGMELAKGNKIDDILKSLGSVAEGVKTTDALFELAKRLGISTPVTDAVYNLIHGRIKSDEMVEMLMSRELKPE